jgi:2-polyprenyl-3-methyl-5-hydroxy-6-metoxy-1,4-benzoquinol methylase
VLVSAIDQDLRSSLDLTLQAWRASLERGIKVAEVGCGGGAWSRSLALAFPASRFFGFDGDPALIAEARLHAEAAGLAGRISFEVAAAGDFPGTGYHLVTQLGARQKGDDLLANARHVRRTLAPDGCWMVLEPSTDRPDQARLRRLVFEGGFTRIRCASATPTDVILEARP